MNFSPRQILDIFSKKIKVQFLKFLISGFIGTGVDYVFYIFFLNFGILLSSSKTISFIIGNFTSFIINKFYTFDKKAWSKAEIVKYIILTLVVLFTNVSVNKISVMIFNNIQISFVIAVGCHLIVNFIGQKIWVFNK